MILVLEINGGLLHLFSSAAETMAELEVVDIENGEYEFCDETGQRFVGEVVTPVSIFRSGSFVLRPVGAPDRGLVSSIISRARTLERVCDGIKSLNDLRRL
jgi:hypothetical protein